MDHAIFETIKYVDDLLGLRLSIHPYPSSAMRRVPFLLRDTFAFYAAEIAGARLLVLLVTHAELPPPSVLQARSEMARQFCDGIPVLVLPDAHAYLRDRLIQRRVSFIVPGRQMYLPSVLIDLRERFPAVPSSVTTISPPAQLVLLYHLQREPVDGWTPSMLAVRFGYSRMTMTRAVRDLLSIGACGIDRQGRNKLLRMNLGKAALWEHARAHLRSPISRTIVLPRRARTPAMFIAGIPALSHYTSLAEDTAAHFAAAPDWRLDASERPLPVTQFDDDCIAIEIWRYDPAMLTDTEYVDPLSLYLACLGETEERIAQAVAELPGAVGW